MKQGVVSNLNGDHFFLVWIQTDLNDGASFRVGDTRAVNNRVQRRKSVKRMTKSSVKFAKNCSDQLSW